MPVPILHIAKTDRTPKVAFDALSGVLALEGRSIHRDPVVFYQPLCDWLDRYMEEPCHNTTFSVNFEYISSPSLSYISDLFIKMKKLVEYGHVVQVHWHYLEHDDEMKDLGKEYARLQGLPIQYVEIKDQ